MPARAGAAQHWASHCGAWDTGCLLSLQTLLRTMGSLRGHLAGGLHTTCCCHLLHQGMLQGPSCCGTGTRPQVGIPKALPAQSAVGSPGWHGLERGCHSPGGCPGDRGGHPGPSQPSPREWRGKAGRGGPRSQLLGGQRYLGSRAKCAWTPCGCAGAPAGPGCHASWPCSAAGCNPPSLAPQASPRTCWCACCSSRAAQRGSCSAHPWPPRTPSCHGRPAPWRSCCPAR